jgi:hypothetical protein
MTQTEICTKTDAELVEIWRSQLDYREDVVEWVGAEIARRGLNTEHVQLMTVEDQARREQNWHSSVRALMPMVKFAGIGMVLFMGGLVGLWESVPKGDGAGILSASALLIGGILFLWLAVRKSRRIKFDV